MKHFVIIFRQGPRELTPDELKKRADETRVWAQRLNQNGHALDPRMLAPEAVSSAPGALAATGAGRLTALLFFEAASLDEAASIARSHPGLAYGATFEVRPWNPPAAPQ